MSWSGGSTIHSLVGALIILCIAVTPARAQQGAELPDPQELVDRFEMERSGASLVRPTQLGAFVDVAGRRAALFGYENETFEAWIYPLKAFKDFKLAFEIEGYPLPVPGPDVMTRIDVRPEATIITYTHSVFTVRQIMMAPVDDMGLVVLLDIDSARPLKVHASFRPDLSLMWPAGLMTGNLTWDADAHTYSIFDERQRYVAKVGAPGARDVSIMPYQEEPRDVPTRFILDVEPDVAARKLYPIVVAGSVEGMEDAQATYDRLLSSIPSLYQANVEHYRTLLDETMQITTPDERLNQAFDWAKVGIDKGVVTNPMLGTGLIAGYRTSGASERPGFAWFFGRDALWTAFAITSYGDYALTRTALDFLKQYQRDDGKIPHEISQSADLVPWFEEYPYPWASADATPLYVIVHADHWRATGDRAYLEANWESLKEAYAFTAATDTDGNNLVENTDVGHGWVEGGELYPAHEEIYMQGIWIEASESMAELADVMGDGDLAQEARANAQRTSEAMEATYWLEDAGHYAFAVRDPGSPDLYREDTVLPAVPMWWGTLDSTRAQTAIDNLGSGSLATNWGARILSAESDNYDPLSYHNGSVWPLFTGWASMGAYQYTRPHVGYQALMASALLTEQDALGYVTELLSGDYNTAFGRTSHHQIWSEAMVVTPAVRGLLGLEVQDAGQTLRFAPQLPAAWDSVAVRNVRAGDGRYRIALHRTPEQTRITVEADDPTAGFIQQLLVAPALPHDAQVEAVTVNGTAASVTPRRQGDRTYAEVRAPLEGATTTIEYQHTPGTDVHLRAGVPLEGATNDGLRVLRAQADQEALSLTVEGQGGQTYTLPVYGPHPLQGTEGVAVSQSEEGMMVEISFEGSPGVYVRRTLRLPIQRP